MGRNLVGYRRVSTSQQGASGLGIEGQQAAIDAHVKATGCTLLKVYTETESGKRSDRPELLKALAHAKRSKATLVIAKLDRLSRNVAFLANLMEAGVDFVACDNPTANKLTVHILAAVAEDEAQRISDRTRAALTAYKARGGKLGAARPDGRRLTPEDSVKGREKAQEVRQANARAAVADLVPAIVAMRGEHLSLRAIAARLNAEGHVTRRGKAWSAAQVLRLLDRAESR